MNAEKAIGELDSINGDIARMVSELRWESDHIAEQWEAMRGLGAQRADHAASLLGRLRGSLSALSRYCCNCEEQIDGMVADPFGRKVA